MSINAIVRVRSSARMLVMFVTLVWALCGCGGGAQNNNLTAVGSGGGSSTTATTATPTPTPSPATSPSPSTSPSPGATATVVITQTLTAQTTVPASVVNQRFTGVDSTNKVVFGPTTVPKAATITLTVPVTVVALSCDYLDANGNVLFVFAQTVTLTAGGTVTISNPSISPPPGPAARVAFTVQPSNVVAGSAITPAVQVQVQDASGNPVTTSSASITIAIGTNPGSGTLGGTATATAILGTATFSNLTISAAGNGYTLTAASTGLTGATSSTFNVTSTGPVTPVATALKFLVQPSNIATGGTITPAVTVQVVDANNAVVTTATNNVTLALGANPGGATLGGTLTQPAVNGVATFNNLTLNKGGNGYTLVATATGLTSATSATFKDIRVLSFAAPVITAATAGATSNNQNIATGDFSGDHKDDVVTTDNANDQVAVGIGDGAGNFAFANFATFTAPASVAVGDFDGDGKLDIVAACNAGNLSFLKGNGNGTFNTKVDIFNGKATSQLTRMAVGDFDNDGKPDVMVTDTQDQSLWLYRNTGNFTFTTFNYTTNNLIGAATLTGINAADFNGDGKLDVAMSEFGGSNAVVWLSSGTTATPATLFPFANIQLLDIGANAAQAVIAADFNNDGKPDVAVPDDSGAHALHVFFNPGNGVFGARFDYGAVGDDPFAGYFADFNLDGFIDIGLATSFGSDFQNSDFETVLSNGNGTFKPFNAFIAPTSVSTNNFVRSGCVGDFNGDGLPDSIIRSDGVGRLWVFLNTSQ